MRQSQLFPAFWFPASASGLGIADFGDITREPAGISRDVVME
jgi:hypothetical protein